MTKATTNHYFNTGFPDDPILLDPNMVVRTDVESVSENRTCMFKARKNSTYKF
jgi:hypothetical protein